MGVIPAALQMKSRVVDAIRPLRGVLPVVTPPERRVRAERLEEPRPPPRRAAAPLRR